MCYNRWEYDIVIKKGLNITNNNGNGDFYEYLWYIERTAERSGISHGGTGFDLGGCRFRKNEGSDTSNIFSFYNAGYSFL